MDKKPRPISLISLFGNGMVLQRDEKVKIWGEGEPGESLKLDFAGQSHCTEIDGEGNWEITLSPLSAGGPFQMEIVGYEELILKDIYVGDVWLLGGQSNMELPVARTLDLFGEEVSKAENPQIRHFAVPQNYEFSGPQTTLTGGSWQGMTPQTVLDFSAVGYFFAQDLYAKYEVPIGLVSTAVGGTPIEAWMEETALEKFEVYQSVLDRCRDKNYISSTIAAENQRMEDWYTTLNADDQGLRGTPWFEPKLDDSNWQTIQVPAYWRDTELKEINGSIWFRKEFEVSADFLEGGAVLRLGAIIDADETYLNGTLVGKTEYQYPPRCYDVQKGILKEGRNILAVRVIINGDSGAFVPEKEYSLTSGSAKLDLSGVWKYKVGTVQPSLPHATFFQFKPTGVYNAMIAPLQKYAIKGILWYQGESNIGAGKRYTELFETLIQTWRKGWDRPELPFLFVQLPNFGTSNKEKPMESGWAELREAQRETLKVPKTAMAVAIDIGEATDIHPLNKKDVGRRLSLLARQLVYGEQIVAQGPFYSGFNLKGSKLEIEFDLQGSTLVMGGEELLGFELCGPDGKFFRAKAKIMGEKVVVESDQVASPVGVRYAWADDPVCNLYNEENLPAVPFEAYKEK